jgi:hypothetical protein
MTTHSTSDERRLVLPGDSFVHDAAGVVMHAVTIAAPPESVWPWLVQMGAGRAGWYSYDWVDNDGRPSITKIIPALQHLIVGDIMPSLPGATDSFVVAAITPPRDLVLTVTAENGSNLVSWEFFLQPIETHSTRLMVRGRVGALWPGGGGKLSPTPRPIERIYWLLAHIPRWLMIPAAMFGHGLMQARQAIATHQAPCGGTSPVSDSQLMPKAPTTRTMSAPRSLALFPAVLILSIAFYVTGAAGDRHPIATVFPISALMAFVPMIAAPNRAN